MSVNHTQADQVDQHLVQLAAKGDQIAFTTLYQKYFPSIYRFCYWQSNNVTEAEDLTQNTFLNMAKSIKTYQAAGSFKNWIYTIAKRQINAWLKKKYQLPQAPLLDNLMATADWIDPNNDLLKTKTIKALLKKLDSKKAQVLTLRYLKNYSVKDTAQAMKISMSNVKVLTHRALNQLKKQCNLNDTISMKLKFSDTH